MDSKKIQLSFFIILFVVVAIVCLLVFLPFMSVLAIAAVLAVVLNPVYESIKLKLGGREKISAFIVVVLTIICVLVPLVFIGSTVFDDSRDLYYRLSAGDTDYLNLIVQKVEGPLKEVFPNLVVDIRGYVDQGVAWISSYAGAFLTGTVTTVLKLVLGLIALFYMLKDGPKFKKSIMDLSPLSDQFDKHIFDKLEVAVNAVVKGTLLIALLQGVMAGIGLAIFGVPSAALWGLIAVVGAIVPGLGTGLVIIPSLIYLIITGSIGSAIGLAIWGFLMVGLIDNLLAPILYSRGTRIHPMIILFSVLGGIAFFGPLGFIFGPLIVTLLYVLLRVYKIIILQTETEEELDRE